MDPACILVVDDSPTALKAIGDALDGAGYRVVTARDGEEALTVAQREHPDLIVLDIVLPKKNGYQVCRQLRRDPAIEHVKILLLSCKSEDSDRFWGQKQGADDYLTKPIRSCDLIDKAAKMLAGRTALAPVHGEDCSVEETR